MHCSYFGNVHRICWVHKELKGENIDFLHKGSGKMKEGPESFRMESGNMELAQPWLFGSECARPEDVDSKISPERKNNIS